MAYLYQYFEDGNLYINGVSLTSLPDGVKLDFGNDAKGTIRREDKGLVLSCPLRVMFALTAVSLAGLHVPLPDEWPNTVPGHELARANKGVMVWVRPDVTWVQDTKGVHMYAPGDKGYRFEQGKLIAG